MTDVVVILSDEALKVFEEIRDPLNRIADGLEKMVKTREKALESPWDAQNERFLFAEDVRDILALVMDEGPEIEEIQGWTVRQAQEALEWAGALHMYASDNIVRVPDKPDFLKDRR
ncbi:MAG: hypothetical protein JRG97_16505 [Deltaproteobacteria bacterium]|nr:hypothetical protein [Deltaproteobacteria bacterium]